jgi:hypothetical protein
LSREPYFVTTAAWFLAGLEAKLVFLDPPLAEAFVTHGRDRERAVSLEDLAPMSFIRQLHPWEFRLTRELLEFRFTLRACAERNRSNDRGYCDAHFHRLLHWAYRGALSVGSRCDPTPATKQVSS